MKTTILFLMLATLCSCGTAIQFVNDRYENGTFKPTKDVLHPITGETPIGSGRIYVYPHGDVAVSASGTGAKTLKLKSL